MRRKATDIPLERKGSGKDGQVTKCWKCLGFGGIAGLRLLGFHTTKYE